MGKSLLLACKHFAFAPVDHGPRAALRSIGIELRRIYITQVDDHAPTIVVRYILPHLAGENDNRLDRMLPESPLDKIMHPRVVERRQADRLAGQNRFQPSKRQRLVPFDQAMARSDSRQLAFGHHIRFRFTERADMDTVLLHQVL